VAEGAAGGRHGGATYFVIDNAAEPLGSAALDSAITAGRVTGRILGQSREAVVAIRWTWATTGNNIVVRGDLARRCYWIRMVSPLADPSKRTGFRHPELLSWASDHRPALVAAVLTLVRAWFAAGSPPAETPAFGSFERWTRVIGGVLDHAGIEGFLGNLDGFRRRVDRTKDEWETFVTAWWSVLPDWEITMGELTRRMLDDVAYAPLRDALPASLSRHFDRARPESYRGFATALGRALAQAEGRRFGDGEPLMFVRGEDAHAKTATWKVTKARGAQTGTRKVTQGHANGAKGGDVAGHRGPAGPISPARERKHESSHTARVITHIWGETGPAGPASPASPVAAVDGPAAPPSSPSAPAPSADRNQQAGAPPEVCPHDLVFVIDGVPTCHHCRSVEDPDGTWRRRPEA
jgi:hypothetical protein